MTALGTIPILLLAAGQSRRMRGGDKLLEVVDGVPLIQRQVAAACAATDGPVLVALPPYPHDRYVAISGFDVVTVSVEKAKLGLSESIKAGLVALPDGTNAVMILLADLPELTTRDLQAVLGAVDTKSDDLIWRGTTEAGVPGHPVVLSELLFQDMLNITGDTGGAEIMRANRDRTHFVALPGQRAVCDLDTPEEWASWRASRSN